MTRLSNAPDHRLFIAGSGSQRAALERLAAELRVSERVTFLGARSDVPALLAAADALVLSSANEGMPNALMEAFAAGTPAVATDVGGVREIMVNGESGFVVPPGDAEALAAAMGRLMELPPSTLRELGASGRHQIEKRFSVAAMAAKWRDLLASEIAVRGG
jgi:glycosyltransferase involved in cell wall biosynthesis